MVLFISYIKHKRNNINRNDCPSEFDTIINKRVYIYVDKMPVYPGGNTAILKSINENISTTNLKNYQTTYILEFVIESNNGSNKYGNISQTFSYTIKESNT